MQDRKRAGLPTPMLDSLLPLLPHAAPYDRMVNELHATRPTNGFGPQSIPVSEFQTWCDVHGIGDREFRWRLVRRVDAWFMRWWRLNKASSGGGNQSSGNHR